MSVTVLALALVSALGFPQGRARRIAVASRGAEIQYNLPVGLLAAVSNIERRGKYLVAAERRGKHCSVLIPGVGKVGGKWRIHRQTLINWVAAGGELQDEASVPAGRSKESNKRD